MPAAVAGCTCLRCCSLPPEGRSCSALGRKPSATARACLSGPQALCIWAYVPSVVLVSAYPPSVEREVREPVPAIPCTNV